MPLVTFWNNFKEKNEILPKIVFGYTAQSALKIAEFYFFLHSTGTQVIDVKN